MNDVQNAIETSLSEIDRLRTSLKRVKSIQVQSADERSVVNATVLSWFNNHRTIIVEALGDSKLSQADDVYNKLLALSEKGTTRAKYDKLLKTLRGIVVALRTDNIVVLSSPRLSHSSDKSPIFSGLIADVEMQAILSRRWEECATCTSSKAPLAATVMMGGLLEALVLARINRLSDKSKVFTAQSAPKDRVGKTLPLGEWTLKNYIEVAHELGWISQAEKDLGVVLRDYRNFIHPYKERSHGIKLEPKDARMLWELSKTISKELLIIK